jgi:hypothetical protein
MSRISQTLRELSLRQDQLSRKASTQEDEKSLSPEEKVNILDVVNSIVDSFSELLEVTKSIKKEPQQRENWNSWRNSWLRGQEHFPVGGIEKVREKKNHLIRTLWSLSDTCRLLPHWENISPEIGKIIRLIDNQFAKELTQDQVINYRDRIINLIETPIKEALK